MTPELMSLISGLLGAIIGAAASIVTVWVQARLQYRRDMIQAATTLAVEDYKVAFDTARQHGATVSPIAVYVFHHAKLLELLSRGRITAPGFKELMETNKEVLAAMHEGRE